MLKVLRNLHRLTKENAALMWSALIGASNVNGLLNLDLADLAQPVLLGLKRVFYLVYSIYDAVYFVIS